MLIIKIALTAAIFLFEWNYLKQRGRKKKTYIKTMGMLVAAVGYCLFAYYFQDITGPNHFLEKWLSPLQNWILLKQRK